MNAPTRTTAALAHCPYCERTDQGRVCAGCGRDRTTTRTVCDSCKRFTPSADPKCCHCGAVRRNELRWKIPVIAASFVVAAGAGVAIRIAIG